MPHATECANSITVVSGSSPISIPGSTSGYGRTSGPSYSTSAATARSVPLNDDAYSNNLSQDVENMNLGFDQPYPVFNVGMYPPSLTSDPNLQTSYREYNCCGIDHQNLHDLIQHVDIIHRGLIVHDNEIIQFPLEANTVYSQYRCNSMPIPMSVSSIQPSLNTSVQNGSAHEQKNHQNSTQSNFNSVAPSTIYSVNNSSAPSYKQKGNLNNNGFEYSQIDLAHINGFGQINGLEQLTNGQSQDSCEQNEFMLAAALYLYDNSTLRNTNFSFEDQTTSSMSTSLDDDSYPSKAIQMNQQDPLLVNNSPQSFPATPVDYVSSPISSDDFDNSAVVSPISNDRVMSISNLGQVAAVSPSKSKVNNPQDKSPQRPSSSSPYGSINNNNENSVNAQQTSPSINASTPSQQVSYISRQRLVPSPSNGANATINAQQRRLSSTTQNTSYGIMNNSRQRPIATNNVQQRRTSSIPYNSEQVSSNSDPSKSNQRASNSSNNPMSYGYSSNFLQPRRSSTSNIISAHPVVTTMPPNEHQYRINMSNLGQGNVTSSSRPVAQLRRSSTSNLVAARSIATTTPQSYGHISIENNALASYMPSVTTAQYSVNSADSYPMYMSSGETGSGAATQYPAKYQRIQPKAGNGVAMSDVYSDPSIGASGIKSKKRTTSTPSVDNKSVKRRSNKPSDESVADASAAIHPSDLSSDVVQNRGEADIYPYKCAVHGCPKAYKNANGLKYHNEHGHAQQSGNGAREKPWACRIGGCLKTYGSKGGLIYHVKHCHPNDLWALP
ncbi:18833_t:CDS:2 [Funneliformis geosporum]|uniref:12018_t:CDS:1 n=1 Tax=Funneliformis geosporum TaxID=1117311 RepID=A0A9W4SM91_9GLOM|nr:18833_t:CDS:2 [Funneliformis geosporum]CAI2174279.1 12018_t:CDS:2 [Funneliformis geosporum]